MSCITNTYVFFQVFKAEEIASGGRSYHKKCATCFACEKQLTFNTVFDGDDRFVRYCTGLG